MKHTYIAAASSLVLTLALAGPAAAAGSGASVGTGVTGTGTSERATSESPTGMTGSTAKSESATGMTGRTGSTAMSESASGMTGSTAMSGGKSVPSFSELDGDSKGHLTQQDLQDYPELQTHWQKIDVDKNDQIDQSEFSAFEAGAKWQKKQQEEGGSASKMDKSGMDKSGYKREQGGSAIQSD